MSDPFNWLVAALFVSATVVLVIMYLDVRASTRRRQAFIASLKGTSPRVDLPLALRRAEEKDA